MASPSLQQSIIKVVFGLLLFFTAIVALNVWFTTTNSAKDQLHKALEVGERVLEQVLISREEQLVASAQVLTDDFGFKQAVATKDKITIESVLDNHGARISADLMALIELDGTVSTSSNAVFAAGEPFVNRQAVAEAIREGGLTAWLYQDGTLYQAILLTVDAPTPIAVALVGFAIDTRLLNEFDAITQLHTTVTVSEQQNTIYTISTLADRDIAQALSLTEGQINWLSLARGDGSAHVSRYVSYADLQHQTINFVLSAELSAIISQFTRLQIRLILIAFATLGLALLFAIMLSKKLAEPLSNLARFSRKIADGSYDTLIEQGTTREVDELSESFLMMQSRVREREEKISYQASHDLLTGLKNRNYITEYLAVQFAKVEKFQVVGINIKGFRGIGDTFGYQYADECLVQLAQRLEELDGCTAVMSGGEFIWLPAQEKNPTQVAEAKLFLEQTIQVGDVSIPLSLSIGWLNCPSDAENTELLFRRLNIVLDEVAKGQGVPLSYSQELEEQYLKRLAIITELKSTLADPDTDELDMYYQPKLNMANGEVQHLEALIRWNNKKLGFVSPDLFIGIAEHAGLIRELTHWVIRRVLADRKQMQDQDVKLVIAINLSAQDVVDPDLLGQIQGLLTRYGLSHQDISFEITESDLLADPNSAIQHLKGFRKAGFSLAIDDFGTGYSSLGYLQKMPVNALKVDKSFVMNLDKALGDQSIVRTIISLAHSFGMEVVAEGVENKNSLALLKQWGCEWAQGYYISKPLPLSEILIWYHEQNKKQWLREA